MFDQLTERVSGLLENIGRKKQSLDSVLDELHQGLVDALLGADVNDAVAKDIAQRVRSRLSEATDDPQSQIEKFIRGFEQGVQEALGSEAVAPKLPKAGTTVWMLVGLQGTGKTTTTAKIARWAKEQGHRPYLVPLDVRRPAAIEQLQTLGNQLEIPVYETKPDDKPLKVAQRALMSARKENCDLVLLDTAGRLSIDQELMDELNAIKKKIKPDEMLLVVDGMQGQTAVETARAFDQYVALSGLVLTKMDGDAKGGAAISARAVTGKSIKFMGTGEKPENLELFDPQKIINRILDRGDLEALASEAEQKLDKKKVEELGNKMLSSKFNLEDFRAQIEQMEKLGSFDNVLSMLPGGKKISKMVGDMDAAKKEMNRTKAIIDSMTQVERRNARILNMSRRKRIAAGSGTSLSEINKLLKDFEKMQKMMRQMRNMNPQMMAQMAKGMGKGKLPF